ncbi:RNA polymerase sigma factor [Mucilaginibacter terrae]|uniref:RNA polymerase sigma-70 factor (Family 1) n=1 Tax=Mucilaginibacter terrae TaxID=1955052 RepID=A0ABU3H341_9SPHI|nr:sigma-70 family RNA polymerase sigma factor [Mucilaginibacter terrae]MDT3405335.1 RNA polymerase sigma-70 factor (family 1) [Mucilaginibacter terrae]
MRGYKEATDEDLFLWLKEDDERAFNNLFERYWDRLLETAFYKLQSQTEAEEVVQQIFLDIWRNRAVTQLKYTFRTYISAALRYSIYAAIAQRKKNNQVSIDSLETDDFIDDSTREWLTFNDVRDKLELLVSQLPEKCELVFRMSREDGKSVKDIAEELNISTKTVEAHITKALKVIKSGINQLWLF